MLMAILNVFCHITQNGIDNAPRVRNLWAGEI